MREREREREYNGCNGSEWYTFSFSLCSRVWVCCAAVAFYPTVKPFATAGIKSMPGCNKQWKCCLKFRCTSDYFLSSCLELFSSLLVPARLSTSPPPLFLLQLLLLFPLMAHMDIEFSFLLLLPVSTWCSRQREEEEGEMQSRIEVDVEEAAAAVNRSTSGCLCFPLALLLLLGRKFPWQTEFQAAGEREGRKEESEKGRQSWIYTAIEKISQLILSDNCIVHHEKSEDYRDAVVSCISDCE